ncbi:hypothetical protein DFH09DRAFT_1080638 [Mycena vulgaris]|nr:hypothetical protein DFH09DRAFT_1080638 [Mycena vulgaris]
MGGDAMVVEASAALAELEGLANAEADPENDGTLLVATSAAMAAGSTLELAVGTLEYDEDIVSVGDCSWEWLSVVVIDWDAASTSSAAKEGVGEAVKVVVTVSVATALADSGDAPSLFAMTGFGTKTRGAASAASYARMAECFGESSWRTTVMRRRGLSRRVGRSSIRYCPAPTGCTLNSKSSNLSTYGGAGKQMTDVSVVAPVRPHHSEALAHAPHRVSATWTSHLTV